MRRPCAATAQGTDSVRLEILTMAQIIEHLGRDKIVLEFVALDGLDGMPSPEAFDRDDKRGFRTPHWNGRHLFWKNKKWLFRRQRNGVVRLILTFLENNQWKGGVVTSLDPDQVDNAAKYLRKRTAPFIRWQTSNDGFIEALF
jgi:hypothetical protein